MTTDPTDRGVDDAASTLNELIQACKDGENGFRTAALAVLEPHLRQLFESYAQQRAEFAAELELEVRRLARDPVGSGHPGAALHRSWLDIKAGLTGREETEIITECERSEAAAMGEYRRALDSPLPADLRMIVERHLVLITEAYDHIRSLERSFSKES
jgi:uncharacterized protein (TIGR02284 family)